jgi:hypothetical protein
MVNFVNLQRQQGVVEEEEKLVEMMPCHAMPAALRCACPVGNVRTPCRRKNWMDKTSRKGTLNAWTEECKNNWRGSKIKKKGREKT